MYIFPNIYGSGIGVPGAGSKNINETKADYIADVIHNLSFNEKEFASSDYLKNTLKELSLLWMMIITGRSMTLYATQ